MSENYNMDDLFHPKVEMEDTSSKSLNEYQPSADKGQNGVYKSVIRFLPWWENPNKSISEKWVCWLVDPITDKGRYVDCPSSIGKPSVLQDMFFKLRKADSVQEQNKSKIFSRRHNFAALIQVIKDDQNKEAEGKIFIWKFGKKVWDKLNVEKKPVIGDPHEPFDLLDGKAFALVITKQSGFNNYDQSRFLDKKIPLIIKDGEKLQPINEKTPQEVVFNYLKENSPDLKKYAYKEWDQETHEYVNQVIVAVTGTNPAGTYADIQNAVSKPDSSGIETTDLSLDDIDSGLNSLPDLEVPDINMSSDSGIGGDLGDALDNI